MSDNGNIEGLILEDIENVTEAAVAEQADIDGSASRRLLINNLVPGDTGEEELHSDPDEIYNCILANFGGSCCLTSRITDPSGGMIVKIQRGISKMILPKKVKWHVLSIFVLFVVLCLHMFDYVKDIGRCHTLKLDL